MSRNKWTDMIIELQSLSQAGLTYGRDDFDLERYGRIRDIVAEMMSYITDIPKEKVGTSSAAIRATRRQRLIRGRRFSRTEESFSCTK